MSKYLDVKSAPSKNKTPKQFQVNAPYSLPASYASGSYDVKVEAFDGKDFRFTDDKFFPPSLAVTLDNIQHFPFLTYNEHRKGYFSRAKEATYGQKQVTELSNLFFSEKNITLIQKLLKNAIRIKTNGKIIIEDQDENDVLVIMMAVYEEYGRDLPTNIPKQIFELNSIVVQATIPGILTQCKQYASYIKDISTPRIVLDQPQSTKGGRKGLPSITSLF